MTTTYRKGSLESKLDSLLPNWPAFNVFAHELWNDGDSLSVNDSWCIGRNVDRETAIAHLRGRWEVFKLNYAPKARVSDLHDASYDDESPSLLEVDCIPFAEVRNASNS